MHASSNDDITVAICQLTRVLSNKELIVIIRRVTCMRKHGHFSWMHGGKGREELDVVLEYTGHFVKHYSCIDIALFGESKMRVRRV